MVTVSLLMLSLLPGRVHVAGSGYPKDSTTAWCSTIQSPLRESVYRCYPNPWGSGSSILFIRFPDSSDIKGCLRGAANLSHEYGVGEWIFIGGSAPFLPKLTLDQDRQCLEQLGVVNTATPGDSVELEFWFTPADTVVSDTVRGTFKAWYRGQIEPSEGASSRHRANAMLFRWTRSGLLSSRPLDGPVRLTDLRGRICPLRARTSPEGTLLVPKRRLSPGLYRLTWPQGSTAILVP